MSLCCIDSILNAKPIFLKYYFKSVLLLILALLVSNAARGLASRLAGGLALATAAAVNGLCNILGLDGLNSFHL